MDAAVMIQPDGFRAASADYIVLTGGDPGNAATTTATLGGATITNNAAWQGRWTSLGRAPDGTIKLTVQSATAVIVKLHADRADSGPR
jgi:hypothetical protein